MTQEEKKIPSAEMVWSILRVLRRELGFGEDTFGYVAVQNKPQTRTRKESGFALFARLVEGAAVPGLLAGEECAHIPFEIRVRSPSAATECMLPLVARIQFPGSDQVRCGIPARSPYGELPEPPFLCQLFEQPSPQGPWSAPLLPGTAVQGWLQGWLQGWPQGWQEPPDAPDSGYRQEQMPWCRHQQQVVPQHYPSLCMYAHQQQMHYHLQMHYPQQLHYPQQQEQEQQQQQEEQQQTQQMPQQQLTGAAPHVVVWRHDPYSGGGTSIVSTSGGAALGQQLQP
eukprot:TRINITY_DN11341_c1_g1_i2.p1 TRINITY_DN11341_c1_g1~~TRINITY_DN11341_c1_g1_i2.p1  ORF type:complete len:283 (+),score=96.37 TRINITY_DN11341_c1_g1_i2:783-1631(+)